MTLNDLIYIASSINITNSKLDILPSNLFKESFGVTAPWLLYIVNASLLSGLVPDYFKQACVQSLLEKPALDPTLPHNYHPIAKLPLLWKIIEKVVAKQLLEIMMGNGVCDKFQSGLRKSNSTETALLRVMKEILMSTDSGNSTLTQQTSILDWRRWDCS